MGYRSGFGTGVDGVKTDSRDRDSPIPLIRLNVTRRQRPRFTNRRHVEFGRRARISGPNEGSMQRVGMSIVTDGVGCRNQELRRYLTAVEAVEYGGWGRILERAVRRSPQIECC